MFTTPSFRDMLRTVSPETLERCAMTFRADLDETSCALAEALEYIAELKRVRNIVKVQAC